jgi:hypothetical protein
VGGAGHHGPGGSSTEDDDPGRPDRHAPDHPDLTGSPEEEPMNDQLTEPVAAADRGLLVRGIALLGVGGVIMALGAFVTGAVAVRATRRWVNRWEQPPRAVARQRIGQARSAVAAGTRGWRDNGRPVAVATDS